MTTDAPLAAQSGAAWQTLSVGPSADSSVDSSVDSRVDRSDEPFAAAEHSRYALGAELGVGGMGVVRCARDRRLDREVAYKYVAADHDLGGAHTPDQPSAGSAAAQARRRFVREAKITAFLEHPAIVPIYDAGQDAAGAPFYTMRLVRGRALADAVAAATNLPARLRLLRHFLDTCEAVAYAHRQGVVHRDLKPHNVMVGEFGETQVVDWGLACWHEGERRETQTGVVVGTPAYMSPEQARGEPVDPRSDVWSLGVMLWQLVAGGHPLAKSSTDQILETVRKADFPALQTIYPAAPPELCAIVGRSLSVDPSDRYDDAKALAADVARYLDGRRVHAYIYSPWEQVRRLLRAYRAPVLVALIAVLTLVGSGLVAARRIAAQSDRATLAEREARQAERTADTHLAQSLMQHAQAALAVEARAEAEIFAVEALLRVDSPEARGVLAGFGVAPRPRLVDRTPMPSCLEVRPSRAGDEFVCLQAKALELWHVSETGLRRRWRLPIHVTDAAILQKQGQVLLAHGGLQVGVVTLDHGSVLAKRSFSAAFDGGWEIGTAGERTLARQPNNAYTYEQSTGRVISFQPCPVSNPTVASALSTDQRRVCSICSTGVVVLHDARTGKELRRAALPPLGNAIRGATAIAWSADDRGLIVGGRDGTVAYLDVAKMRIMRSVNLGLGEIRELRAHPTRTIVAVMGERGGVLLWQPQTAAVLGRFPAGWADTVRFSPTGDELWLYGTELRRWRLPAHPRPVKFWAVPDKAGLSAAQLSPDGSQLALLPGSGELNIFSTSDGRLLLRDRFQKRVLKGGSFSPDGSTFIAYGASSPAVRLYDARTWKPLRTYPLQATKRAVYLANGWLIAAPYHIRLDAYPPASGLSASNLAPAPANPTLSPENQALSSTIARHHYVDMTLTQDAKSAYILSRLGRVDRVDSTSPPRVRPVLIDRSIRRIAVDPAGQHLALARRRDLVVLSTEGTGPRITIEMGAGRVFDVALSRDCRYVAVGNLRRTARVWRVADRTLVAVLRGHSKRISHVSFDRTGARLLTGSWDGSARLWDLHVLERSPQDLADEVHAAWGLSLHDVLDTPFR